MLIIVYAPHFVAGYDTMTGNIAPIIRYMRGWPMSRITSYCQSKRWSVITIPPTN